MELVDSQLRSQAKTAQLYRPIKFVPARTQQARFVPGNSRFKPINPKKDGNGNDDGLDSSSGNEEPERASESPAREKQKRGSAADAFDGSDEDRSASTSWEHVIPIGTGLPNLGNTCYLNSALQCLLHTPPLANLLLFHSDRLSDECPNKRTPGKICFLCELRNQFIMSFNGPFSSGGVRTGNFSPPGKRNGLKAIVLTGLPLLGKHFKVGRQMDSHEFLMCVENGNILFARKLFSLLPRGILSSGFAFLFISKMFPPILFSCFHALQRSSALMSSTPSAARLGCF